MPPETQPQQGKAGIPAGMQQPRQSIAGRPPETQPPYQNNAGKPLLQSLRTWRTAAVLVAVAGLAAALIAATPLLRPADPDEGTLRGLQIRVLTISQAAAENRMDGALAALDALEKDVNDAAGRGQISLSRYRGIEAAVDSVRADITGRMAAVSAAVAPTAGTADTPAATEPAQVQQPVDVEPQLPVVVPAAPAPAPVQEAPVLPQPAKDKNKDKGKGKDQGKQ
ncbi:hypothetical protein ACFVYC_13190 [Pseudarthrobacter sp. NPDC058329]|uniref:hypothetical protein n=1 Tax=Pseudarthrobacter sp. NPDC058329 TaxID=3346448 RepID=UPI0036D9587B